MTDFFQSSFGQIAYTDSGNGRISLIFMHGFPTSKELFSQVIRYLKTNYRIITFDLTNYGESEKIDRYITHDDRADIVDELRAYLKIGRFNLIAHDLGASVAIDYIGKYASHVTKLVLISPPVYPDFKEPLTVKVLRIPLLGELLIFLMRDQLFKMAIRRGMVHKDRFTPDLLRAFSGVYGGKTGRAVLRNNLWWGRPAEVFGNYPQIIESITIPTLIIQGRKDPYIPASQVERLHRDIHQSKLVYIENGGHFLPIDTPGQIAREINQFIR